MPTLAAEDEPLSIAATVAAAKTKTGYGPLGAAVGKQIRKNQGPNRAAIAARKRRLAFVALIEDKGLTTREAAIQLGIAYNTYLVWRRRDRDFAIRCDAARAGVTTEAGLKEAALMGGGRYTIDFSVFRQEFFHLQTYYHQRRMIDAIETCPPQGITVILTAPEHGKTTLVEDWISYKLAVDPNHRITVVSESQNHARKIIGRVQRRMTDERISKAYIKAFGPFKSDMNERPWTKDYMTVLNAIHDERDFSLEARGAGSAIYGTRVDTLIVDDIQSRRSVNNTDKLLGDFRQDFVSRVGTEGRIIIVGTRVDGVDFYSELLELVDLDGNPVVDRVVEMPAMGEDGAPLCPEMWPLEKLTKKRALVGEEVWWRAYQQKPLIGTNATFSEEMIEEAKDAMRNIGPAREGRRVVLGLDPAIGGGNAIVALGYDHTVIEVLDAQVDYGLARIEDILRIVEEYALRYHPDIVAIEINAFQRGLARDERLHGLAHRYGFRVREHTTQRNKLDPVLGVASMASSFIRGEVSLPNGSDTTRKRMDPLVAELRAWRPNIPTRLLRQDLVMAFWFAWLVAMDNRSAYRAAASPVTRKALPWKPTQLAGIGGRGQW